MKSIDELAKGVGVPQTKLHDQLRRINNRRKLLADNRKGWSLDRGKTMLLEAEIPTWVWLHPDFKDTYFANDQDQHERGKNWERFLKKYPQFRINR